MSIQEKIDQLNELRAGTRAGGGEKRIEKQHKAGKLTARERISLLFDPDTFIELDVFASSTHWKEQKFPSEGVVTGYGDVNGRKVYTFAQDFTVAGGSLGLVHAEKICKVLDLAMRTGCPVVGINDSGGARIQEGVDALKGYGEIFYRNTIASGVVPQLSVIMGPSAGGAVYSPALTDFVFMVKNTSQMFITGPQVIKTVTGEEITMEELGGANTHNRISGVAHFAAENEEHCIDLVKQFLSYVPSNNLEEPPTFDAVAPEGNNEDLINIVPVNPNKGYDVKNVIRGIVDGGSFFEIQPLYAPNGIIGFARLDGKAIGIIANQAKVLAGCLDIDVSDKISRFIRFCDCFNIPILTFMDVPGYLPGTNQEYGGIIRHGAKLLYAYSEATVPKITIILRKAYGGAYLAMCSSSMRADFVYAWPTGEIAVMGPEGAVNIVFRNELKEADDPVERRKELVQEYRDNFANPYVAAAKGYIDDVIDPRDTRDMLIKGFQAAAGKRVERPRKKHGNIPV